jgi:hypothetical protein
MHIQETLSLIALPTYPSNTQVPFPCPVTYMTQAAYPLRHKQLLVYTESRTKQHRSIIHIKVIYIKNFKEDFFYLQFESAIIIYVQ